jgi:hypothetical protein
MDIAGFNLSGWLRTIMDHPGFPGWWLLIVRYASSDPLRK